MNDRLRSTSGSTRPCPCGSGRSLGSCCAPRLSGVLAAPTAEALMRSRYTAYVLGNTDYLLATWCSDARPDQLEVSAATRWLGLQVIGSEGGGEADHEGTVEFVARFLEGDRYGELHEISGFGREQGMWCYRDGVLRQQQREVGRNQPCPCGSGRKFKRCHGA